AFSVSGQLADRLQSFAASKRGRASRSWDLPRLLACGLSVSLESNLRPLPLIPGPLVLDRPLVLAERLDLGGPLELDGPIELVGSLDFLRPLDFLGPFCLGGSVDLDRPFALGLSRLRGPLVYIGPRWN